MAFVDGEPLDASKLGDLELKVNNLAAKIPQIGSSNTNISITGMQNATATQTTIQPHIQAANAGEWLLVPGQINRIDVKFPSAFPKTPHVILTTRMSSTTKLWHPAVNVATGTSTSTGFSAVCYMPTDTKQHKVYLSYIAIAY
jgi:hypothetical protein